MEFRVNYSPKADSSGLAFDGEINRAKQEFKKECDINTIMKRYATTGVAPVAKGTPLYGDFSEVGDFQETQNTVLRAEAAFNALPVAVRERFNYDPARMIQFLQDKANLQEARKLGLVVEEPVPAPPMKVEVVNALGKDK